MACEVGIDAADGYRTGFLARRPGSPEQRRANARETVGLHGRHGISSALSPRGKRVLLGVLSSCLGRMVSKRWRKSKRQDIEFVVLPAPVAQQIPLSGIRMRRLSGEIARPRQRRLTGERIEEQPRTIGRVVRKAG